jgi:predicted AlkP superfamily phosphohydrolase/phosphomutase
LDFDHLKEKRMSATKPKGKRAILLGLDGSDPLIMKRLMAAGRLPNIKKVIARGVTTEGMSMLGAMPTITPPNWASLATGAWPMTHGITCFWNHTRGQDLLLLENGFSSRLSEAEFIWDAASMAGKKSILFNYVTGWPPTKPDLTVVDGTGISVNTRGYIDYDKFYTGEAGNFPIEEIPHDADQSGVNCMVEGEVGEKVFDVALENNIGITDAYGGGRPTVLADKRIDTGRVNVDMVKSPIKPAQGWPHAPAGAREVVLPVNGGKQRRFGLLPPDEGKGFTRLQIYASKQAAKPIGEVNVGQWSEWIYDTYRILDQDLPVAYKVKLKSLAGDGSRFELYSTFVLCLAIDKWFQPPELAKELFEKIGPMVHMSACGDDQIMWETQAAMYDWYNAAMHYLATHREWDLLYAHVHAIDFANHKYQDKILAEHSPKHEENLEWLSRYYDITDRHVGEVLKLVDEDTVIFLVSDHGGMSKDGGCETPLIGDPWNVGSKILEDMGYLVVRRENGKASVDWAKTRAISQRSGYLYVNLKGRDPQGSVTPEEYDALVEKIIDDLYCYRDPKTGRRPISFALRREDMPVLGLGGDHCGDIYFCFTPGFARVHGTTLTTTSNKGTSVACLFVMAGAGVKKGEVIKRPVRIVDIVPTICHLVGIPMPRDVEGGVIYQALAE